MEPKEYEILCLSVVNKLFLTRKDNIKRRPCCLHRGSKEGSFPWPAVVAAHDRKRLAAALRTGNLWQQRKLTGCKKKNYPCTQDWGMSFRFYHALKTVQNTISDQSRVFAVTVTKAQGQTFQRFAIYPPSPVFLLCQLYVAFSRYYSFLQRRSSRYWKALTAYRKW